MNAILKFKEGKKIGKYLNPAGPLKLTPKDPIQEYYDNVYSPDGAIFGPSTARVNKIPAVSLQEQQRRSAQAVHNAKVNSGLIPGGNWNGQTLTTGMPWQTALDKKTTSDPAKVKIVNKAPKDWGKEFNNFTGSLSSEQLKWLSDNGLNDATKLLDYLTNMGFGVGRFGSDGKFGKDSKAAWNNFVASGIMGKNNDEEILAKLPEQQKVAEPIVDAPDPFGYLSIGNYSVDNVGQLKTDGIRDWTTMMNYIKGNQNSAFSKDMMHRFGNDLSKWNQKDIESAMGVGGNYGRRDRSRILGFMAGNLANWRDQRNTAISNFAKQAVAFVNLNTKTLGDIPGTLVEQGIPQEYLPPKASEPALKPIDFSSLSPIDWSKIPNYKPSAEELVEEMRRKGEAW